MKKYKIILISTLMSLTCFLSSHVNITYASTNQRISSSSGSKQVMFDNLNLTETTSEQFTLDDVSPPTDKSPINDASISSSPAVTKFTTSKETEPILDNKSIADDASIVSKLPKSIAKNKTVTNEIVKRVRKAIYYIENK